MRDIVERLELQAFVAEKTQSGMKPLIMDCLDEITRLRERLAEADEANRRVSDENEKLREALIDAAGELQHAYIMGFTERYRDAARAARAAAAAIRESGE